jgi:hypothetical protein
MIEKIEIYEIVVCGGGMAGLSAALASARMGRKTCLIHDRPVFGGNSSSEIRVTIHGAAAFHAYARETGIISELLIEERSKNHAEIFENGWTNSVWDMVLYDAAVHEENLTFYLNTHVTDVIREGKKLKAVKATILNAETIIIVEGKIFIDCTGDGIVADKAGCEWRMGTEGRDEFNEPHAPITASSDTMGNSLHFRARDMGHPIPFKAPDWAIKHDDPAYFYEQGRIPKDKRGGFWWLEIGIPYHTIYDNEIIRHELTRHTLGVWDWMKNHDPVMKAETKNYALDWIGQVPGKRESRRIMGEYLVNEHDIVEKTIFPDEAGYGGWFVDLHTPGGLLGKHAEEASATYEGEYDTFSEYMVKSYCGPYSFPLRALIAKDLDNLMMAGRNISATHSALGTLRVMGTSALMGQAAGVAAAVAIENEAEIKSVPKSFIKRVQQQLLRDGCFLLNTRNSDENDLALKARVSASSHELLYGAGPETKGKHAGLSIWKDQPQYDKEIIETQKGQIIAIGSGRLDSVSVCLTNNSGRTQEVRAILFPVTDIWDYRVTPADPLATTTLMVPAGKNIWVDWEVSLTLEKGLPLNSYIRIDLCANKNVSWPVAGCILPGHTAMYQIGENKMRRYHNGSTFSFKVSPGQDCYRPENVVSGVTRPHKYTNVWISDSNLPLDQWLKLSWDSPQKVSQVELTIPGHLLREYHAYGPFYHDPQCPQDYFVEGLENGEWKTLYSVSGNYQRQNKLKLERVFELSELKVVVKSTNGEESAQIYEIRVY